MSQSIIVANPCIINPQFRYWRNLPTELKLGILRQCLIVGASITARSHAMIYAPLLAKLSLVSKEMHEFAMEVYYRGNIFAFSRSQISTKSLSIFRFPQAQIRHEIRRVELRINIPTDFRSLEELFDKCTSQWYSQTDIYTPSEILNLIRPHRARMCGDPKLMPIAGDTKFISYSEVRDNGVYQPRDHSLPYKFDDASRVRVRVWRNQRSRHTSWQKHFPELKELRIVVQVDGCLKQGVRTALQELPRTTEVFLRAKTMQVDVKVPDCTARSQQVDDLGLPLCDGQCAHFLQSMLEYMLEH